MLSAVMLSVLTLCAVRLNVLTLSAVMLSVVTLVGSLMLNAVTLTVMVPVEVSSQ